MRWRFGRKRHTFDSPPRPIDQLFAELYGAADGTTVSRNDALSVPAVLHGRNIICAVASMPLEQVGPDNRLEPSALLRQVDPDVPNVVTVSQTVEDLLFEAVSWWEVTAVDFAGFPVAAKHLDVKSVSVNPPNTTRSPAPLPSGIDPRDGVVWVDGEPVPWSRVIRFDSPNPAVLHHAGREVRRAILLDKAAGMYADDPRPADYFTPADGAEELDDDEVKDFLGRWKSARKQRTTAYIPSSVNYHSVDAPAPRDLQLAELSRQVSLDIANALGIDPEDLGLSTTSRTYSNDVDRRRNRLNDVLAPYMRAITDRLSMGDVTRRGYRIRFNTTEYLQPNPTDRWGVYSTALGIDAMTLDEVRAAEGLPPLPAQPEPEMEPVMEPEQPVMEPMEASGTAPHTFDSPGLTFADVPVTEFSVDRENRIIEGVALPYGRIGVKGGMKFRFQKGALEYADVPRVKLVFPGHGEAVGKAMQLSDTAAGFLVRFKVGRGAEGDRALELAEDGVYDGLSVGVDFDPATDAIPDPRDKSVLLVRRADLRHVALTAEPVFDDARVTRVAADRTTGDGHMADETTESTTEPTPDPTPQAPEPVTFSADQVRAMLAQAHQDVPTVTPDEGPTPVNPTRGLTLSRVSEPTSYTFDTKGNLLPAAHDFSTDLIAGSRGDNAALARVNEFVRAEFDVVGSNVATLNPARQRPDMYVDQRDFRYPVWDAINKGTLSDNTPFVFPKFNSASGLVANHVEGTEPTSGAFAATNQTVTPTAKSGKVKISREVWDAGGNPQVSALIWRQMTKAWFEALEAAAVAVLDAATPTSLGAFTVGGGTNKQTLVAEMETYLAALQFVRGGFSMDNLFAQVDLYQALVAAKDTSLRPYYASVGPQNARGTVESRFGALDVNGVTAYPAWALAATGIVPASSYLFDSGSVHGWASTPQRIDITLTEVANVYVGLWGYVATAISDINGVREVIYDPAP